MQLHETVRAELLHRPTDTRVADELVRTCLDVGRGDASGESRERGC